MRHEKDPFPRGPETPDPAERQPRTKKQVIAIEAAAMVIFVLGFCSLLVPAVLSDENGHYHNAPPFVVACVVLMLAALVLLVRVLPDALAMEFEAKLKKLDTLPLSVLPDAGKARVGQLLQQQGFEETPSGLYRNRAPAGIRARYWYYIALADAVGPTVTYVALDEQLSEEHSEDGQACLIAFLYKAGVTEEDKQALKERSAFAASAEGVLAGLAALNTTLPVLVDTLTGQGYYLAQKGGITLYACGCRFLKKHFQ